jgi:hypothetical protein
LILLDRMIRFACVLLGLLAATSIAGQASQDALTKQEIASAESLDAVTIPIPGEFFTAMAKVGQPAWSQYLKTGAPAPSASRSMIALALGTLVADGYVAVEARDGQGVKNIGKEILALAKKLNVSQSVLGRSNSIGDFADANDWNALREELEATQNEVKLDMAEQNDDRLLTLVSLGAWIRGVELVSGMVSANYTPESASLLSQPAIVKYLIARIDSLPESARTESPLPEIRTALHAALPLVEPTTPTAEQVAQLHTLMQGICTLITGPAKTP